MIRNANGFFSSLRIVYKASVYSEPDNNNNNNKYNWGAGGGGATEILALLKTDFLPLFKLIDLKIRAYTKLKSLFVIKNVCFPLSIKLCKSSRSSGFGRR